MVVVFIPVLHHFRIIRSNESMANRYENYVKFIKIIILITMQFLYVNGILRGNTSPTGRNPRLREEILKTLGRALLATTFY